MHHDGPIDFEEANRAFDELIDLPADERTLRLHELRITNARLADFVVKMLQADERDTTEIFDVGDDEITPAAIGPDIERDAADAYDLHEEIGRGSYGVVYRATQKASGKPVAVKMLRDPLLDPKQRARFIREIRALSRMRHTNIASLVDAGQTTAGGLFMVTEFVDGRRLDRVITEDRPSRDQRLLIFKQILNGVAHLHDQGVVHRDLKPSNILVERVGRGYRVQIIDLGIAHNGGAEHLVTLTADDAIIGTPAYMAPEQFDNRDARFQSDVFSLGLILFELLVGSPLRTKSERESLPRFMKRAQEPPKERPSVIANTRQRNQPDDYAGLRPAALRGDLDAIILKSLAPYPGHRYANANAFRDELDRHERHEPIAARRPTFLYEGSRIFLRHRIGAAVAAALLSAALLSAGVVAWATADARARAAAVQQARLQSRLMQASAALARHDYQSASTALAEHSGTFPERFLAALADNTVWTADVTDSGIDFIAVHRDTLWVFTPGGTTIRVDHRTGQHEPVRTAFDTDRYFTLPSRSDTPGVVMVADGQAGLFDFERQRMRWTIERPDVTPNAAAIDIERNLLWWTPLDSTEVEAIDLTTGDPRSITDANVVQAAVPTVGKADLQHIAQPDADHDLDVTLAVESSDPTIRVLDDRGHVLEMLRGASPGIRRIVTKRADDTLWVFSGDRFGRMHAWRLDDTQLTPPIHSISADAALAHSLSTGARAELAVTDDISVAIATPPQRFTLVDRAERVNIELDHAVTAIYAPPPLAPDIFIGDRSGAVTRYDVESGAREVIVPSGPAITTVMSVSASGDKLYIGYHNGAIVEYEFNSGERQQILTLPEPLAAIDAVEDGRWLLAADGMGTLSIIDTANRLTVAAAPIFRDRWFRIANVDGRWLLQDGWRNRLSLDPQ